MEKTIILISVLIVAVLGILNLLTANAAEPTLLSGYISDNDDEDGSALCRSRMLARAGNTEVGHGSITGGRYIIELTPGWEKLGSIEFLAFDNAFVHCATISTEAIIANLSKSNSLEIRCGFENINCWYYYGTEIEGTGWVYQSKFPAQGRVPGYNEYGIRR
jgi:hypothetical protein